MSDSELYFDPIFGIIDREKKKEMVFFFFYLILFFIRNFNFDFFFFELGVGDLKSGVELMLAYLCNHEILIFEFCDEYFFNFSAILGVD